MRTTASANEIRHALAETAVEVSVDFIARETLAQWRDVSARRRSAQPPTRRAARALPRAAHAGHASSTTTSEAARFAEEVPALLQRTLGARRRGARPRVPARARRRARAQRSRSTCREDRARRRRGPPHAAAAPAARRDGAARGDPRARTPRSSAPTFPSSSRCGASSTTCAARATRPSRATRKAFTGVEPRRRSRCRARRSRRRTAASTPRWSTRCARPPERIRAYHERQREHSSRVVQRRRHRHAGARDRARGHVRADEPRCGVPVVGADDGDPGEVAGVSELIMMTPAAAPDGVVSPLKLVAADIAGVDRVFAAGGAEAIAALAYGTETVPRVDKIVGPGNIFVTLAKREVFGGVGIDALYGPSETIVIADETADPMLAAADLLAQAEHDELATPILLTTSETGRRSRRRARSSGSSSCSTREQIARASFDARGGAVVVDSVEEAVELASEYAPEHLCLLVRDAATVATTVRNAGGIFVGDDAPESLGDYTAGPSHVMPTSGAARYASPLGVHDFLKVTSVVAVDAAHAARGRADGRATIARAEGFTAHARSIELRLDGGEREAARRSEQRRLRHPRAHPAGPARLPGYVPIEPTDVLAERLGIAPDDVHQARRQREPVRPSPRALEAIARRAALPHLSGPGPAAVREALADVPRRRVGAHRLRARQRRPHRPAPARGRRAGRRRHQLPADVRHVPVLAREIAGGRVIDVPRQEDFALDIDAIEKARAPTRRLIFLASPNNPTGNRAVTATRSSALLATARCSSSSTRRTSSSPAREHSAVPLVREHENLVVLRTFSKWAGLAGPARRLRRHGAGARVAADDDQAAVQPQRRRRRRDARRARGPRAARRARLQDHAARATRMSELLAEIDWLTPYPSEANFILCRLDGVDARRSARSGWRSAASSSATSTRRCCGTTCASASAWRSTPARRATRCARSEPNLAADTTDTRTRASSSSPARRARGRRRSPRCSRAASSAARTSSRRAAEDDRRRRRVAGRRVSDDARRRRRWRGRRQLRLRLRNMCLLGRRSTMPASLRWSTTSSSASGSTQLREDLGGRAVLLRACSRPSLEAVRERERQRGTRLWRGVGVADGTVARAHPALGLWLDTSGHDAPKQTVDEIMRRAWDEALVVPTHRRSARSARR